MRELLKFWLTIAAVVAAIAGGVGLGFAVDPEDVFSPASAHYAQAAPQWSCEQRPWLAGVRVGEWAGDTGGVGSALPDGYVAVVSSDTVNRRFTLFLYDGDDTTLTIRFDDLQLEPWSSYPTGRFDPQGLPIVTYHAGQLKIWLRQWQGGLFRIYTWCGLR